MTINPIMHCLPLLGEDHVVLVDHILDSIGGSQHLLPVLLSIHLDPTDLGPMGSPLLFSIIHLKREEC